jgi:hypothetical protein
MAWRDKLLPHHEVVSLVKSKYVIRLAYWGGASIIIPYDFNFIVVCLSVVQIPSTPLQSNIVVCHFGIS